MSYAHNEHRRLHLDVTSVGLRDQAIAVGFVQLCKELRAEHVLSDAAFERIKGAIADDLSIAPPRGRTCRQHRQEVITRLDQLLVR